MTPLAALAQRPRRDRCDRVVVLRALRTSPRFTSFDVVDAAISTTIERLKRAEMIEVVEQDFPYFEATITAAGHALLALQPEEPPGGAERVEKIAAEDRQIRVACEAARRIQRRRS